MANIEFIQGQESHSSNWGKYYVKGLEKWECKEDGNYNKHQSYSDFQCNNVPEGTVFTIFEQSGNKRGTDVFHFQIFVTTDAEININDSAYGQGKTAGNFRKLAHGEGKVKAPRLMTWWTEQKPKDVDPVAFAEHCQAYINKRGVKDVPPMEVKLTVEPAPEEVIPSDELAHKEVQVLIKRYGLETIQAIVKDRRMTLAYDGLLWRIDAGWEYPDAHTTVCQNFGLSVEDGEELTRRYDKTESQQLSE